MFGFIREVWEEISFEKEFLDDKNGRFNSWLCFWLIPSVRKIRARTNNGSIFVATSGKADRLKVKYQNLEILNAFYPSGNSR
jgi:hypothetical protein